MNAVDRNQRRRLAKARRQNQKREARTFVGYIGLSNGRPDAYKTIRGKRVITLFLNERKAKQDYADVALVTVTGIWSKSATPGDR